MIHLDTSALVGALSRTGRHEATLRQIVDAGERTQISTPVLYEWLRGSRTSEEIAAQRALFPDETTVGFGPAEATLAAGLYRTLRRPRTRATDLAVSRRARSSRAQRSGRSTPRTSPTSPASPSIASAGDRLLPR